MNDEFKILKEAYSKIYLKSRSIDVTPEQQDLLLGTLIEEFLSESLQRIHQEDPTISEEKSSQAVEKLRRLFARWKNEFEKLE